MAQSHYEVLGVAADASREEITKAYRKRALRTHPDRGGDEQEFKRLAAAYETLSDGSRRRRYDQRLKNPAADGPAFASSSASFDPFYSSGSDGTSRAGSRAFDIFDELFPEFSSKAGAPSTSAYTSSFTSTFGGPSLIDSLFGSVSMGGFGAADPLRSRPSSSSRRPSEESRSSSTGVTRNVHPSNNSWSFSTSFGTSTSGRASGWTSQSQSKTTRIVNGQREDTTSTTDALGDTTVHKVRSDGTEQVTVNGVENRDHPLLASSSSTHAVDRGASKRLGTGSAQSPIVVD